MTKNTIPLDEENINKLIRYWRKQVEYAQAHDDVTGIHVARCYIDAFQTVRVNHGLDLLE